MYTRARSLGLGLSFREMVPFFCIIIGNLSEIRALFCAGSASASNLRGPGGQWSLDNGRHMT